MKGRCTMNTLIEPKDQDSLPQIDEQRRRLSKGGLAAPIVLGTLLSRPVLGAAPYSCTISGKLSGNMSSHGEPVECFTLGRSPGYWRQDQHKIDWLLSPFIFGTGMINGSFKPIASPTLDGSQQATEGTLFTTAGFLNVFKVIEESEDTYNLLADPTVTFGNATLLQVVAAKGNEGGLVSLGRAAVASLLNAHAFAPNFPLTPERVVAMFNAVANGGSYAVNDTTYWDHAQVKEYFESLYEKDDD